MKPKPAPLKSIKSNIYQSEQEKQKDTDYQDYQVWKRIWCITTDPRGIKRIIREYYEQPFASKLYNT